jgi:hypothetical protein
LIGNLAMEDNGETAVEIYPLPYLCWVGSIVF